VDEPAATASEQVRNGGTVGVLGGVRRAEKPCSIGVGIGIGNGIDTDTSATVALVRKEWNCRFSEQT
jgi:hypothetical protein